MHAAAAAVPVSALAVARSLSPITLRLRPTPGTSRCFISNKPGARLADLLRGLIGLATLLLIAYLLSQNRRAIQPRVVLAALATAGRDRRRRCCSFRGAASRWAGLRAAVNHVIDYGNKGIEFLFGGLVARRCSRCSATAGSCSLSACYR